MGELTPKQAQLKQLAALKDLAMHVGLIAPCKPLRPNNDVLRRRISEHWEKVFLCFDVLFGEEADPVCRAAAGLLLECFIPDWMELAPPEVIGTVVTRESAAVREWRRKVFERDGDCCVRCGSTNDLEAHHVVRWVDAPQLRIMVDNGLTLCKTCHGEEYGQASG